MKRKMKMHFILLPMFLSKVVYMNSMVYKKYEQQNQIYNRSFVFSQAPIDHGAIPKDAEWTDVARPIVQQRMQK
jgi:hypothetical protein